MIKILEITQTNARYLLRCFSIRQRVGTTSTSEEVRKGTGLPFCDDCANNTIIAQYVQYMHEVLMLGNKNHRLSLIKVTFQNSKMVTFTSYPS